MKKEIKCNSCHVDIVVIENNLFFSGEINKTILICPSCKVTLDEGFTDGWFFVQTIEQYAFQLKIDKQKEIIKFEG